MNKNKIIVLTILLMSIGLTACKKDNDIVDMQVHEEKEKQLGDFAETPSENSF